MDKSISYILNLSCPDQPGIVAAVAQNLFQSGFNIVESHQFGDPDSGQFFMRVALAPAGDAAALREFEDNFAQSIAPQFGMHWRLFHKARSPRTVILVSKFDHCLVDLLYRSEIGSLDMDIVAVVSNHELARKRVEAAGIPFHSVQGGRDNRETDEAEIARLIDAENIELIVLARYMQILSAPFAERYTGRIINIHHSFLPSFKGAVPYSRAFERGVKMIGATAHFVTGDLDEGPIITQGVADIRHDMGVEDLIDVGRDVERRTLARAIRLYTQRRVLLNGIKTVVFE
jgi:formyltetrahydrofolate deformylase